jgi:ADP-heptose:LPS heptosyltransferase
MGDVVLLVPVVRSLIAAYPDVEVTVVTRPKFASFFTEIERVVPYPADVDYTYNGIFGMRELFRKLLQRTDYDVVIDMHDHIRTIVMRTLFKLFAVPVVVFDKGRSQKKKFTRKENKDTTRLPHTVERYREAFEKAGFSFPILPGPHLSARDFMREEVSTWLQQRQLEKKEQWIGIAPFAMHTSKIWPLAGYPDLIRRLTERMPVKIFLFGGGDKEVKFFEALNSEFPEHCVVVAGQLKIKQELALMERLDLMICTDSSNMHLASLMSLNVLSIWGGTHPDVGFGPFAQPEENILQISRDELPCRPCSVYGRESCYRGDFACLNRITPEMIVDRAQKILAPGVSDRTNN